MPDDRLHQKLPPPLHGEVTALKHQYHNVRYDADERVVVLDVDLCEGWTPRTITLRIKVPKRYPQAAPQVVLPWELRCHGVVPRHMLISGQYLVRGQLGDNIRYYPEWEQTHTLKRLVDTLVRELNGLCGSDESRRLADA